MPEPRSAFDDLGRRMRERYADPADRIVLAYLAGRITIEEMEAELAKELGLDSGGPPTPPPTDTPAGPC